MTRAVLRLLLVLLVLGTATTATDRSSGTFVYDSTGVSYSWYSQDGQITVGIGAVVYTSTTGQRRAELSVVIFDNLSARFLNIYVPVPVSTFKLTSTGFQVNIGDLHDLAQFVSESYYFSETGFAGQAIPANCTVTKTMDWQQEYGGRYTERAQQSDGTTTLHKERTYLTETSAHVEGNVADYVLLGEGYLTKGTEKIHFP
jgi:hypothetical protein